MPRTHWYWSDKKQAYFSQDDKHLIREVTGGWELHSNFGDPKTRSVKHGPDPLALAISTMPKESENEDEQKD